MDKAVSQAETRMMAGVFTDIRYGFSTWHHHTVPPYALRHMLTSMKRTWVRAHAQDYILEYFTMLTTRRKNLHAQKISHITDRAWHYYHAQPHPTELAAADMELKRGIDEDWKASVQRYPEVLEYFYGLVDLSLPGDDEPRVSDPPLSALGGGKGRVRVRSVSVGRRGGRRERREERGGRERERHRVQFAPPTPGYGYVHPPGY